MRSATKPLALAQENNRIVRLAKPASILGDGSQHRLNICRGSSDHAEDLACRGLLLQRLAKISGALTQLVEQARILDGDDGLIREGLDQRELLGGEGSNLRPPHRNRANEDTFATHRHAKKRPDTATFRSLGVNGTPVRIGLRIADLYCPILNSYAPDDRAVSWPNLATASPLSKPGRRIVIRGEVVQLTVRLKDEPLLGRAKPRRIFDKSFENGLEIERRAADDLEQLGRGGLLLQRFAQLIEQARVLDGDHSLGGKVS